MPDFFGDPENTPDPARFRSEIEREARRRHARRVTVTSASAAVVLVATGVGVGLAAAGSGSARPVPIDVAVEPTSPAPVPSLDSSSPGAAPTPTPTPTPSGFASSTPAADTSITVYGNCRTPTFEPTEIVEACADYGIRIENIHWTTWTSEKATGVGTYSYNDCTPNCANGHFHNVPNTTVTLTEPKPDATGQLVYTLISTESGNQSYSVQNSPEPLPTQSD